MSLGEWTVVGNEGAGGTGGYEALAQQVRFLCSPVNWNTFLASTNILSAQEILFEDPSIDKHY